MQDICSILQNLVSGNQQSESNTASKQDSTAGMTTGSNSSAGVHENRPAVHESRPLDKQSSSGYQVGEEVEYHSSSYNSWIAAQVLGINPDGTLELNVRPKASASLVRRKPPAQGEVSTPSQATSLAPSLLCEPSAPQEAGSARESDPHQPAEPPPCVERPRSPLMQRRGSGLGGPHGQVAAKRVEKQEHVGTDLYPPPASVNATVDARLKVGDRVEYYSQSYSEWLPAVVLQFNADGTVDLDVKQEASISNVRLVNADKKVEVSNQQNTKFQEIHVKVPTIDFLLFRQGTNFLTGTNRLGGSNCLSRPHRLSILYFVVHCPHYFAVS
jgi:hypothetical protein